jgi:2-oxoglutarate dehydrogenase complex dehydrogenase (E1) component-like enzyme
MYAACQFDVFFFFAHSYIGRKPSASTATGIKKQHKIEEKQMLKEAMAL